MSDRPDPGFPGEGRTVDEGAMHRPTGLTFEARNSMKIMRRDGTIEEIPGEWETITEDEAKKRFGDNFKEWLKGAKSGKS